MKAPNLITNLVIGLFCFNAAAQTSPSTVAPSGASISGEFSVLDYGAKPDGTTDCTAAFQSAIDAAAVRGGVVRVPVGKFRFNGHVLLKKGVHLEGINQTPQSWEPATGTILLATEGRDREDVPAFIEMRSSSSVRGVTIYYPDQNVDDIRPYPWTFQIRGDPADTNDVCFDTTIENVTLINSYNGIRTGPTENGRHRILSVHGCVLRRGILVDWTGDIGRIENVQFHCHFWAHPVFEGNFKKIEKYMQQNLEAFIFGRSDWEYVANTFVYPAKVGYHFIETHNGACNGQFSGIGADACDTCVLVETVQPQGLLFVNGEFNSHIIGRATQVVVGKNCRGNIRFVNCGFWGPVEHNATLLGPAFYSFSDCYFRNDNSTTNFAIVVENGKFQVNNSTFDAPSEERRPGNAWNEADVREQSGSILLKPGVQHAIIRGNNGYYGVKIVNEIGKRAIINDNEPWQPAPKIKKQP